MFRSFNFSSLLNLATRVSYICRVFWVTLSRSVTPSTIGCHLRVIPSLFSAEYGTKQFLRRRVPWLAGGTPGFSFLGRFAAPRLAISDEVNLRGDPSTTNNQLGGKDKETGFAKQHEQ